MKTLCRLGNFGGQNAAHMPGRKWEIAGCEAVIQRRRNRSYASLQNLRRIKGQGFMHCHRKGVLHGLNTTIAHVTRISVVLCHENQSG